MDVRPTARVVVVLGWLFSFAMAGIANRSSDDISSVKVLILGAGFSGIVAANTLKENGIEEFLILEGSTRICGRIMQEKLGDFSVPLGAQWIHGSGRGRDCDIKLGGAGCNPLVYYANQLHLTYNLTDYDDWIVRDESGTDVTEQADIESERFDPAVERMTEMGEGLVENDAGDMSQAAALNLVGWFATSPIQHIVEYYTMDFEFAEPPQQGSAKYGTLSAIYDDYGEEYMWISDPRGLCSVAEGILNNTLTAPDDERLIFNQMVREIKQNTTHVMVTTSTNKTYVAEHVMVTFSVGVLQNQDVSFVPELPDWKRESIFGFDMAVYCDFYLQWSSNEIAFWDAQEWILYASRRRGYMPVIYNLNKIWPGSNILQITATGDEAKRIEQSTDAEVQEEIMTVLRTLYGGGVPDPIRIIVPRFSTNPLFRGAYSNWPPGYDSNAHAALKSRVGRVHFAGEALHQRYFGFVNAAYESGIAQTKILLACLKNGNCEEYVPPYQAKGCTYKEADNYDAKAKVEDGSCMFREGPCSGSAGTLKAYWLLAFVACAMAIRSDGSYGSVITPMD